MTVEPGELWESVLTHKTGRAYWQQLLQAVEQWRGQDTEANGGRKSPGHGEISRRDVLALLASGMVFAGVSGCKRLPPEEILPYSRRPPEITPGIPLFYATTMPLDGYGTGLVVESHEGRPTKIEGNPDHPASLGAAGVYEQASILGLYDPARARATRRARSSEPFEAFRRTFATPRADRGAGLRFLMEPTSSMLVRTLLGRVLANHPEARITMYSPARTELAEQGALLAFGRRLLPQYDLRNARVVLSLDADFLGQHPFQLRYARQFAERRRTENTAGDPDAGMVRLYITETMMSVTGSMADHRLARPSRQIGQIAAAILAELGGPAAIPTGQDSAWIKAVARDLKRVGSGALVIVGERQPPEVHAIGHWIQTMVTEEAARRPATPQTSPAAFMTEPVLIDAGPAAQGLTELARDLWDGRVDTLVMLEGNPVYQVPADLGLPAALARVAERIYLGLYEDETAAHATWFIPALHYLEHWGDCRAYDGTESFIQPLIQPLHAGKTVTELLAVFAGIPNPSSYDLLREHAAERAGSSDVELFFQNAVKRGLIAGTQSPPVTLPLDPAAVSAALQRLPIGGGSGLEVGFIADPAVYDGRFATNAWLLELPRPITKLTWDNAAMLSAATARRFGIATEDVIELDLDGRSIRAPALVVPGHADDSITLPLGYGREGDFPVARGVGFNAYRLRPSMSPWFLDGLRVQRTGQRHTLAHTQGHWTVEGRTIILAAPLGEYQKNPRIFRQMHEGSWPSILPEYPQAGEQWAMAIDLSICTGCSACVVACQAENNIPVVGKEGVLKSREMHWLRIDSYLEERPSGVQITHQPMLCQHCEKAPCEYVCPVFATVHSPEGLNAMIYNRCVGTRACSNNCPYKVRRFNWFDWIEREKANQGSVRLQRNPDVTVRERGVMEKCTYCIQRIHAAGIRARIEQRSIREGEVETACQAACPTRAIAFGSLAHRDSELVRRRESSRNYAVLGSLGTRPRTTYLAMITNPNPELADR